MIRLEVVRGDVAVPYFSRGEGEGPLRIGRAAGNDVLVSTSHVSSEHARVIWTGERFLLSDLKSTNGTTIVRGGTRIPLDDVHGREVPIQDGDQIHLGIVEDPVIFSVGLTEEVDASRVVAVRQIDDLALPVRDIERRNPSILRRVYESTLRIGGGNELDEVLRRTGDAVLDLVSTATHATLALRDDDDPEAEIRGVPTYIPILTRVRGSEPSGPIPITRSVFRKVVQERAAVLAADAPAEVGTASLLGARIRSTLGVPLWRGSEILGILQVDSREGPDGQMSGIFNEGDLDVLSVLAGAASLAIANARLIHRLHIAEERLRKENSFLKGREEKRAERREIIGSSRAMAELKLKLDKVVNTRVTVLIEGETGVGKELVASAVHYRSNRRDKLFVAQNCAALPENLLESELFGHKKGAFTGATDDKRGLFEMADGGTLFLDEMGEMSLGLQAKLLRALQEGEIRPVGATKALHVNVRIVAATNRDLKKEVAERRFREDLYYRLAVFPLRVPPLRERRDDIPQLAAFFLDRYAREIGKPAGGFAQQTMELLQAYDWPGNVRELENEVQRIVIQLDTGDIARPELLSPRIRHVDGVMDRIVPKRGTLKEMCDQVEKYLLLESLREHLNNKTAAAKTLGITREGLHKKLRGFGIS